MRRDRKGEEKEMRDGIEIRATKQDTILTAVFFIGVFLILSLMMIPRCEVEIDDAELSYGGRLSADTLGRLEIVKGLPSTTTKTEWTDDFLGKNISTTYTDPQYNFSLRLDRITGNGAAEGRIGVGKIKYSAPIWHSSCSAITKLIGG